MKQLFYLLLFSLSLRAGDIRAQYSSVSFYVVAHPDDWQLFMGTDAITKITSREGGSKVVIVYTTAGDGSFGNYPVDRAYCAARMDGANRSIQFCADTRSPHTTWDTSYTIFNTQGGKTNKIKRLQYKNVVCYCLNLPDGCGENGNINTLSKLAYTYGAGGYYSGYCNCKPANAPFLVPFVSAVDSSATYNSYDELKETVASLLHYESEGIAEIIMNAQDTDPDINPGDHPDHIQTGALATDIANMILPCAGITLYQDYNNCKKPSNLTPDQVAMKAALLAQISYGRTTNGYAAEWDPASACGHVAWTSRDYSRVIKTCDSSKSSQGTANTALFPNPARSTINISCRVPEAGNLEIAMYDVAGRQLTLILNEHKQAGSYLFDNNIEKLIPGDYLIYIKTAVYRDALKFTKQ